METVVAYDKQYIDGGYLNFCVGTKLPVFNQKRKASKTKQMRKNQSNIEVPLVEKCGILKPRANSKEYGIM